MPPPVYNRRLPNYLRTFRKKVGLSQSDIAYLLGIKTSAHISRYEHFRTLPSLATALAFEVIFRVPAKELYAGVFNEVEREIVARAGRLVKKATSEPQRFGPGMPELLRTIAEPRNTAHHVDE